MKSNPLEYTTVAQIKHGNLVLWQPDLNIFHTIGSMDALPKLDKIGGELVDFMNKVMSTVKLRQAKNMILGAPVKMKAFANAKLDIEYVTVTEAAGYLGLGKTTIRRMCHDGKFQMKRSPGGHRMIMMSSVKAYEAKMSEPVEEVRW